MGRNKIELDVKMVEEFLDTYVEEHGKTSKLEYKEVHLYFNDLLAKGEFKYPKDEINISFWRIPNRQGRIIIDNYNQKRFEIKYIDIDFLKALHSIYDLKDNPTNLKKLLQQLEKDYLALLNKQKPLEEKVGVLKDKIEKMNYKNHHLETILFSFSQSNIMDKSKHLMKMQEEFLLNIDKNLIKNFNYNIQNVMKNNSEIEDLFNDLED
ncbi:hypothetical protein CSE16_13880 [Solibacillus sp. R5-41]|uniref:hypothetical protein n=1 Tax=Solibacillus sp. R5-41 TaxID=2048654 RepID=UPI000C129052|nr:hypothetical protein [Solibacillus sp. R5-41]ATP41051.1 hypothetical protein CSE16_13880 [Solibacillus sp. R5-41]